MQVVGHQGSPQTNLSSITFQILLSEGGKYLHQKKKSLYAAVCFTCCLLSALRNYLVSQFEFEACRNSTRDIVFHFNILYCAWSQQELRRPELLNLFLTGADYHHSCSETKKRCKPWTQTRIKEDTDWDKEQQGYGSKTKIKGDEGKTKEKEAFVWNIVYCCFSMCTSILQLALSPEIHFSHLSMPVLLRTLTIEHHKMGIMRNLPVCHFCLCQNRG